MKKLFVLALLLITLTTLVNATTLDVKLLDIAVGETREDNACIFEVNGKKGVVDRRDTQIINGVSIYVQEVYPVNKEAQDEDFCEFLYNVVGEVIEYRTPQEIAMQEQAIYKSGLNQVQESNNKGELPLEESETEKETEQEPIEASEEETQPTETMQNIQEPLPIENEPTSFWQRIVNWFFGQ